MFPCSVNHWSIDWLFNEHVVQMIDVHLACCSDDGCSIGTCSNDFLCSTPYSKHGVQLAVVQLTWKVTFHPTIWLRFMRRYHENASAQLSKSISVNATVESSDGETLDDDAFEIAFLLLTSGFLVRHPLCLGAFGCPNLSNIHSSRLCELTPMARVWNHTTWKKFLKDYPLLVYPSSHLSFGGYMSLAPSSLRSNTSCNVCRFRIISGHLHPIYSACHKERTLCASPLHSADRY